jgi:outer membrane protein
MRTIILFSFFNIFLAAIQAQEMLNPEEAINIALKNNYSILVARNNEEVARINNTPGNADMLPSIGITGSINHSQNNINQKLSNGNEIKYPNALSNSLNAEVALNWTLFDGGKMFVTKSKLHEIEILGEIQFKDRVLQTVYDVILAYYDVVRQKQQLASINEVINYNKELVMILQTSFNAGLSPKTGMLQAQIDLNVFQENAINQQAVIIAAKRTLNQILGRGADVTFEVADSIPLNFIPDRNELAQKLDSNNTSILSFQKQVEIARLNLREYQTTRLPRISFNAGYSLLQSNNTATSILKNNTFGPTIGGSVFIPLYQSGNITRQIKTAKLQLQSAGYDLESIKLQVNSDLQNALTEFENQQQLLGIEKDNTKLARENLDISVQRLRFGQTTLLEVRQAQQSFVESLTRLVNFEYNLKVAETRLKQLIAKL